jgi:hypothetical protein
MTVRQRRTDLFVALTFQVVGLFIVCELLRGEYALPLVAISLSAYAAASLASLYVLVVTEFRPIAFESASFTLWILTNALFTFTVYTSHAPKFAENPEHRERIPVMALRTPDEAVRSPNSERNLSRVTKAWSHLPEKTKKQILELAVPEEHDDEAHPADAK